MQFLARVSLFATICLVALKAGAADSGATAPLGAPAFQPSADRPVGWRGDGTGRYPGANPPTIWERKKNGSNYETKGILYMTPLPSESVSTPIVVGPRMFITTEATDLVCIEKQSGRILWIRSNNEFEGMSDEIKKANPEIAKNLEPLLPQLAKANADVVEALNAMQAGAPSAATHKVPAAVLKKREIEKKLQDGQQAIDKRIEAEWKEAKAKADDTADKKPDDAKKDNKKAPKLFERYWGQAVFGFAGQTPTSDGKHVCAFFTTGVTVCYDLDGNRKWIAHGKGGGSEHGNFASPLLCGNTLVVWAQEMRGYDVESGKLLWSNPAKAFNTYGSMFKLRSGNDLVAAFQWGFFTRVRDGKPVWDQGIFGDSVSTPIVEGDTIFARGGYPKFHAAPKGKDTAKKGGDDKTEEGLKAFKIPASTDSGKLSVAYSFKTDWAEDELVVTEEKKNPFDRGYVASPLFVDGLIYQITQGAGLVVNDAATGAVVYRKVLPLKPRTAYWNWAGTSTSPTFAGKYIYLMDNQGTTLVIQPGREYKEVARNFLEESKDGKEQVQNLATPIFEGSRMYYHTPGYLYCIGDK